MMNEFDNISVLVIEDNYADYKMIEHLLSDVHEEAFKRRYQITHAEYLNVGLAKLENSKFDVVILDLNLPDQNGLVTLRKFIRFENRLPVIVMTGITDVTMALEALRDGAQDYLIKGNFDGYDLARTIGYAIERKRNQIINLELALKEERVQMLQRLIGDLSHDFRSPLSAIGTSLYLYNRTQQIEHLDNISQQIGHLSNMLDDFSQMAKLDNDIEILNLQAKNLTQFVRDIVHEYTRIAEAQNRKLVFLNKDENLDHFCLIDRKLLYRALLNIITNSIKYTEDEGTIKVSIEFNKSEDERITAKIIIEDDGMGIQENDIPFVFDRFYRSESSKKFVGTGLGLSIAKKIIELHNGGIKIESEFKQWTRVIITLPVVSEIG